MEDVPLEKQSDYLSSLLTPLCQQVNIGIRHCVVFKFVWVCGEDVLLFLECCGKIMLNCIFLLLQVEVALSNAKPQNPEESLLQIENMQQVVMAINALSKVFIMF